MMRSSHLPLVAAVLSMGVVQGAAQPQPSRRFPLESATGLRLHNVTAEPVTHAGKHGVRIATSNEARRRLAQLPVAQQAQLETHDAFYLRPTNGRAEDQERRNHATQYISHPDWTWDRMRRETPSRYESHVDLVPGAWTRIRIEVRGDSARLFVHGQPQPVLLVNDVKTGKTARGAVALWINPGTVAHFRDVRVTSTRSK